MGIIDERTIEETFTNGFSDSETGHKIQIYIDQRIKEGIQEGIKELCTRCVEITKAQLHYREGILKLVGLYIVTNLIAVLFVPVVDYLLDGKLAAGSFLGVSYFVELVLGILFWSACVVGIGVLGMKKNQLFRGISDTNGNNSNGR